MTAVPRPPKKLTDEQVRLLAAAVDAAAAFREKEDAAWEAAVVARNAGVPDGQLCEATGLSRATLNRKFGARQAPGDPSDEGETLGGTP